jgi:glycosyltransferase involved in cell wall biosynthesis
MKPSVVIPARSEAAIIGMTLDRIREWLAREAISYEIVVVDDGSFDALDGSVR